MFDLVVGNPPYNNDLYIDFVLQAQELSKKYILMITPSKWCAKTGKKNDEFREKIVPYMKKIVVYRNCRDIFDIDESSGISYYLIDDVKHREKLITNKCSKNKLLESEPEVHDESIPFLYNRKIIELLNKIGVLEDSFDTCSYLSRKVLNEPRMSDTVELLKDVFYSRQDCIDSVKNNDSVEVYAGNKLIGYKDVNDLNNINNLNKYKVVSSIMNGSYGMLRSDGTSCGLGALYIVEPNKIPACSFTVWRYFDTYDESFNFKNYIHSKFTSFLVFVGICSMSMSRKILRFVPDQQDYTVIYEDVSLQGYTPDEFGFYTDADGKRHCSLYAKYKLTDDDINLIDSIVKKRGAL